MEISIEELKEILSNTSVAEGVEYINSEEPLSKQGVDSLDLMDFYLGIEEKYNHHIPDEVVETLKSLNDFKKYLEDSL